nr:MAG TPA: hypothetical protein [Caudoviricetes sp.]
MIHFACCSRHSRNFIRRKQETFRRFGTRI